MAATITRDSATTWIDRWDVQQQEFLPDREDRFTVIVDAVEEIAGRPDPLVLDLGCGPGSLAVRLLRRLPQATVVAIDADPLTLALGRAAFGDVAGLDFRDVDLRTAGWSAGLQLRRPPDAAVSTTALHWLRQPALAALYAELAGLLRPGGVLLNGDHLGEDDAAPILKRLDRMLLEREERRRFPGGHGESWTDWWAAAAADPALAPLDAERAARRVDAEHHGSPAGRLSVHTDALRAAGFREVGTLWQRGENRVLCGVLPG
ncbi:MAG TPA: class I SAM-dependent methyltransferase [Streptosporangiaceae bacterium]|jgi:SAM-dependent methyltransferase